MAMPDNPLFTSEYWAARERFNPSAEPFANMNCERLQEMIDARLLENDLAGYWEIEFHLTAKLSPIERFIRALSLSVFGRLLIVEQKLLPYKGWTADNIGAVKAMARMCVEARWTPERFPPPLSEGYCQVTEDLAAELTHQIMNDPGAIERFQAELDRD